MVSVQLETLERFREVEAQLQADLKGLSQVRQGIEITFDFSLNNRSQGFKDGYHFSIDAKYGSYDIEQLVVGGSY